MTTPVPPVVVIPAGYWVCACGHLHAKGRCIACKEQAWAPGASAEDRQSGLSRKLLLKRAPNPVTPEA